jgi:hypothetical protein
MKKVVFTMKRIVLIVSFCIVSVCANAVPFSFNYEQIPFGKPMSEVLELVEGAEVLEDESVTLGTDRDPLSSFSGFCDYFSGGVYILHGLWGVLDRSVAKCFEVRSEEWDKLYLVKLYFVKDKSDYILFMVMKEQKSGGGRYDNIYSAMAKSISKTVGVPQKNYDTEYKSIMWSDYAVNAKIGVWMLKTRKIFLLVGGTSGPTMLYVNTQGWNKYINAIKQYRENEKRETEQKNQPDF